MIECLNHKTKLTLSLIKETNYTAATPEKILLILLKEYNKISFDMLKALCENTDININAQDDNNNTLLFLAIKYNTNQSSEYLLQKGADPTIPNKQRSTALHMAAKCEKYYIINILSNRNLVKRHINDFDIKGRTPLLLNQLHVNSVNDTFLLLQDGANPNLANPDTGNTPLIIATKKNNIPGMRILLKYNANPSIKNKKNKTAYDYAKTDEARELLKVDTNLF